MTRLRLPLSSLLALSLAGAALVAPGCGNADSGAPEELGTVSQAATPGVIITEIAYDPSGKEPDTEWVELYNPGDTAFDIVDAGIQDVGTANPIAIIPASGNILTIPAKGYVVIARSATALGVPVAGTYGTVSLNNSGKAGPNGTTDTVKILTGQTVLDQVDYGTTTTQGWPADQDGTAVQLSADKLEADNNAGAAWCRATATYTNGESAPKTGLGSPGLANIVCGGSGAAGAAGTTGSGGAAGAAAGTGGAGGSAGAAAGGAGAGGVAAGGAGAGGAAAGGSGAAGASGGAGGGASGPVAPAAGELVITEIMADPSAVADTSGEWFEVLNASDKVLELQGIVLRSGTAKHTVATSIVLAPGGYAVFAKNADAATNGGLPAGTYAYGAIDLTNGGDDITLELADATLIDSVSFVSGDTAAGKSRSLAADKLNATDNGTDTVPASDAWCHGTTTYGAGDVGTPGAANDPCGGGAGGAGGTSGQGGASAGGSGGAAGKAGAAGAAGKAGAGGAAGKAGAGGAAGKAGASGAAGKAGAAAGGAGGGSGGSTASGGASGKGGSGTAGASGKGGSGTAGKGGSGTAGTGAGGKAGSTAGKGGSSGKAGSPAGTAGAAGANGLLPEEEADSGCGCRTAPTPTPASPASFGLAALALAFFARRKRS